MAYSFSIISPTQIADHGGDPLVVRQALTEPALDLAYYRMDIVRLTAAGVYAPGAVALVAQVHNGKESSEVELVGGVAVHRLQPSPLEAASPVYRRRLTGYAPRLAPGTYYLRVYGYDPVGAVWNLLAIVLAPFLVVARPYPDEVWGVRQFWPSPPYYTGPRRSSDVNVYYP